MDNPIAGGKIGSDDFGHEINIPRIPSPLLKDAIDAFTGATDGTTVFVVTHFQQMLAAQVGREDFLVYDDMEQQQIHQDGIIRHDGIQGPLRKGVEGSICRCKDSPKTMTQGAAQSRLGDGSAQGTKIVETTGNLGNGLTFHRRCRCNLQTNWQQHFVNSVPINE
jgi:hypothetical protein